MFTMTISAPDRPPLRYHQYLMLVFPFILSTLTTPLLGAVDTALMGHFADPALIGGVAVGVVIFNTLYWLFGFLRVSTTAWSAQALNDPDALLMALLRPLVVAAALGGLFIVLQVPLFRAAMLVLSPSEAVRQFASDYFFILIWGAPFTLINYVLLGWLMGKRLTRSVLFNQVMINIINIVIAVLLVKGLAAGVKGVACATLIAQIAGTLLGARLVLRTRLLSVSPGGLQAVFNGPAFRQMFLVNSDLMVRTVCLLMVTNQFVARGAAQGNDVLAANMILFQIHYLICYLFDGFANASSVFSGQARGAHDRALLKQTLRCSALSCIWVPLVISVVWFYYDAHIIGLFTRQAAVIAISLDYALWLTVFPLCAAVGLVFYGIFTGITWTRPVRNSMLLSLLLWLIAINSLMSDYGNSGLWLSYMLFSAGRSIFLLLWVPGMLNTIRRPASGNCP